MTKSNPFGGSWTKQKLGALRSYLTAYLSVLAKWEYRLLYIDAFAGPGLWAQHDSDSHGQLFDAPEHGEYKKGSTLIALEAKSRGKLLRPFDQFYFIDNNEDYIDDLQRVVREKHENKSDKVSFIQGDANSEVLKLCSMIDWRSSRAVIFLDPFGMEVRWQTIEAIANTKAIDLWVLFPLGVAVNRMLTKDGDIPPPWQRKLDTMFGTEDWRNYFYESVPNQQQNLFGDEATENLQKIASFKQIADYFIKRLDAVFYRVVQRPLMLENAKGNPIFALCFAAGNKRGAPIATTIAGHIIAKRS